MPSIRPGTTPFPFKLGSGTETIGKVYITDGTEDASINTSSQLEVAEANSKAIKDAVEIMDDWDSTNRCKVTLTDGTNTMPTMDRDARAGYVHISDGTNFATVNASNQLDVAVGNTVAVSATNLDIRALTAASDSVKIGDGTHTADVNASSQLSVSVDNNPTLSALPAGTNNIGDVDVASLPALPAGTNNIGDVDIASALPAGTNNIGDVDIASALPAGTNNIGDVDIASALPAGTNIIGAVKRDIVNYTKVVKYVSLGNTNETTIWDPTAGKKFVITDIFVSATAAGTCTFKDGTAGTIFLVASLAANGGFVTNLQTPIQSATADNNLTATASAATQYITVCGYEV